MRKNSKLLSGLCICLALISAVVWTRALQMRAASSKLLDYGELKYLALEYVIDKNGWGKRGPDPDFPNYTRSASITFFPNFYKKSENEQVLTRLRRRFPQTYFTYPILKNSERVRGNAEVEVFIKNCDVGVNVQGQIWVGMSMAYHEPFGGYCGTSEVVDFKRSYINLKLKPSQHGFSAAACQ